MAKGNWPGVFARPVLAWFDDLSQHTFELYPAIHTGKCRRCKPVFNLYLRSYINLAALPVSLVALWNFHLPGSDVDFGFTWCAPGSDDASNLDLIYPVSYCAQSGSRHA